MKKSSGSFIDRVWVSLSLLAVIFLTIYYSNQGWARPIFTLVTAIIIGVALWEFYNIAKKKGGDPLSGLGIVGSIAYLYTVQLATEIASLKLLPILVLFLVMILGFLVFIFRGEKPLSNLGTTFFGLIYLTIPLGLLIPINFNYGRSYLVYLLVITKLTDMGAYFVGKKFGSTKLAPYISPNKSWEGLLGGAVLGLGASFLMKDFIGLSPLASVLLGLLIASASIFGDLTESLLKRDLGVKDSSQLPGLGGFFDLVDSLIFATPLFYFYLKLSEAAL
ncbi:MAG: phosphatidate cytidylyltransferase [Chlamydiia bacterium]|nr:phosphatidate cytidylyltransferase [Chlamydiia bacterium]